MATIPSPLLASGALFLFTKAGEREQIVCVADWLLLSIRGDFLSQHLHLYRFYFF